MTRALTRRAAWEPKPRRSLKDSQLFCGGAQHEERFGAGGTLGCGPRTPVDEEAAAICWSRCKACNVFSRYMVQRQGREATLWCTGSRRQGRSDEDGPSVFGGGRSFGRPFFQSVCICKPTALRARSAPSSAHLIWIKCADPCPHPTPTRHLLPLLPAWPRPRSQ